MDDFLMIRFALDNVHPTELGEGARKAFDRVLSGEANADTESRDGRKYERLRGAARRLPDGAPREAMGRPILGQESEREHQRVPLGSR